MEKNPPSAWPKTGGLIIPLLTVEIKLLRDCWSKKDIQALNADDHVSDGLRGGIFVLCNVRAVVAVRIRRVECIFRLLDWRLMC